MPPKVSDPSQAPKVPGTSQTSQTKNPRKLEKMKYEYQGTLLESKVQSKWDNVGDMDFEHRIDIQQFNDRMYGPDPH